jgi:uroporphyrin-III C-methyltransferase
MITDSGRAADPGEPGAAAEASRKPTPPPTTNEARAGIHRAPRAGRALAALALLFSLAGLGAAGYLYYEVVYRYAGMQRASTEAVADQLAAVTAEVARVDQRLETLAESQRAALRNLQERQDAARAATEEALRESLATVARQAPPVTGEWLRAEVQYLLRIANHRLLMERDVAGALALLQTADGLLAQLDDFALHPVRARVADEIAALQGVQGIDLQGLFLRLEVLKDDMDRLPVRIPAYVASAAPPEPSEPSVWETVTRHLAGYVRLRRFDAAVKPLLAPDEAVYLELNLRLMMERAQLAAVRGEQLLFEQSLATADDWIRAYLDPDERLVRKMLDELDALQKVNLQQPLPDISGSLNALREALRTPA